MQGRKKGSTTVCIGSMSQRPGHKDVREREREKEKVAKCKLTTSMEENVNTENS